MEKIKDLGILVSKNVVISCFSCYYSFVNKNTGKLTCGSKERFDLLHNTCVVSDLRNKCKFYRDYINN